MSVNAIKSGDSETEKGRGLLSVFAKLNIHRSKKSIGIDSHDEICELLEGVRSAKIDWMNATNNFMYASDQELIDYYTYIIKACELRYEYFLKKAKEMGIKTDGIERSYTG